MKTISNHIEPTLENIQATFNKINEYAQGKGYQVKGSWSVPTNWLGIDKAPKFQSKSQMKVVRNYLTSLNKEVTMGRANRFLHMLFKHIYKMDTAPRVEYSEKELSIQAARKAWKKADAEAQKLLKTYKETKGDFYKNK